MLSHWLTALVRKPRPARRMRPAGGRPSRHAPLGLEPLDARELPAVLAVEPPPMVLVGPLEPGQTRPADDPTADGMARLAAAVGQVPVWFGQFDPGWPTVVVSGDPPADYLPYESPARVPSNPSAASPPPAAVPDAPPPPAPAVPDTPPAPAPAPPPAPAPAPAPPPAPVEVPPPPAPVVVRERIDTPTPPPPRLAADAPTPLAAVPDALLLQRYATAADQPAFAELVRRHGPAVQAVCGRVVGDPDRGRDAAQATFVALARRAGALQVQGSVAGWLHRVASRMAVRVRTDVARQRRLEAVAATQPVRVQPAAAAVAAARDEHRAVRDELARLPAQLRVPLELHYLHGRTHAEVAVAIGVPRGSVSKRIGEGLAKLREGLAVRGFG